MGSERKDLRYLSRTFKRPRTLMSRVDGIALKEAHIRQERNKACGIDDVTKDWYGQDLNANIADLLQRMKAHQYEPQPVRRTYIPKTNGGKRPLGIPSYEDKLVQSVMADILSGIYEERFLDSSYGYRPKRGAHDALRYINDVIKTRNVNFVLEADIKGFFDNVNHIWLMKFLKNDIADPHFLRHVRKFLKAGVMEDTEYRASNQGTPQGGSISPVLANVYLHYVLDMWVEMWLKKNLQSEVYYARYADDFVLIFRCKTDAVRTLGLLRDRLYKFGLQVAEDKTRILPIGERCGTKEDFDFLGFTIYNAKTRTGAYRVGMRTSKKKLRIKKQEVKAAIRKRIGKPIMVIMKYVTDMLRGHYNYYGVNGNCGALVKFCHYVKWISRRLLNRRDQRGNISYDKFNRIWNYCVNVKPRVTQNIWGMKPMQA